MNKNIDYKLLNRQLESLIEHQNNSIGQLSNAAALLKQETGWHWVGFYIVEGDFLRLGPFQGPPACYDIPFGKGVCGKAWSLGSPLLVPDVNEFDGHIACSPLSQSEIVVPILKEGAVVAVLDVDCEEKNGLLVGDMEGLKEFCEILQKHIAF